MAGRSEPRAHSALLEATVIGLAESSPGAVRKVVPTGHSPLADLAPRRLTILELDPADLLEHLPHALTGSAVRVQQADSFDTLCSSIMCLWGAVIGFSC